MISMAIRMEMERIIYTTSEGILLLYRILLW